MWDLPRSGIEPVCLALAARFFTQVSEFPQVNTPEYPVRNKMLPAFPVKYFGFFLTRFEFLKHYSEILLVFLNRQCILMF